jgi:GT2 family glycosyltransferase
MLRRSVFEQVGGMDEAFYPAWFDDVDLCRRLRDTGAQVWFFPGAVFHHRGGVARERLGTREFAVVFYRNLERYVRKHHGPGAAGLVKALVAIGMLLRIAVNLLTGDREALQAHTDVLRGTLTGWGDRRQ